MKRITSTLLLLAVFFISACKKESTDEIHGGANVSFKVNGTFKQASGDIKVTAFHYLSEKSLQLVGNLDNNQGISFIIENYNGVGEYDVAGNNVIASYITDLNGGLNGSQLGSTGSIKITTATDKVVKGTFQFVVLDPNTNVLISTISEGKFETKLTSI
jgi:hypothetical protein